MGTGTAYPSGGDPQRRGEQLAQGGARAGVPNAAATMPRSDSGRPAQEGSEVPEAGPATGAPSEGAAGATSEAALMDLGSAEKRAREKEEAAAKQAAADEIFLKDVERQIKAFIEVKLAAEVESARLPEFKGRIIVLLRSAEQAADDKAEAAFQDARAEPEKFKTEPLVTRDRIKELKKELSEREELLQRQVERRTVCENKVVALARDTLARKGSKYHAEARAVLLKDAMRRMDVSLAAVEQMCVAMDQRFVEAEEAKRRAQQQARSAEPRSWQQIAAAKRLA